MPFEPLQLLVGGAVGYGTAGALRWWQYRRDLWLKRVEEFCETLDAAADAANEHWVKEKPIGDTDADRETRDAILRLESKLLGFQIKINRFWALIHERFDEARCLSILHRLEDFDNALTGGSFQASARKPDPDRARLAYALAADIIVDVHESLDSALSAYGTWLWLKQRKARRKRASIGD